MKKSALVLTVCLLSAAALPYISHAQQRPGPMGPSAKAAARLKKYPTSNWLAHYLPDDRYKIASKLWKYVATDLDTYYHIPSSPNMLRQPPGQVIGFASAKDAEEAGYRADPTDGTAARATTPVPMGNGAFATDGFRPDEVAWAEQVKPLMAESQAIGLRMMTKFMGAMAGGGDVSLAVIKMGIATNQELRASRAVITRFDAIRPPARLRRLQSLMSQAFRQSHDMMVTFNNMTIQGGTGTTNNRNKMTNISKIQAQNARLQQINRLIAEESKRLGS